MKKNAVIAAHWHRLENGKIQCDLCPRECKLDDGQHGLCYVRARQGDQLVLTTYGRSSGFCIDPIEKKPLNHFLPGTGILSFGTAGCNLKCRFCQNWDISSARQADILAQNADPVLVAKTAKKYGCRSVAFTYNEPIIFLEYAIDIARECHRLGIKTVAVTAGYINEHPRKEFFGCMDGVNIDLKSFSDEFYRKFCGGKLQTILDTIAYIGSQPDIWMEITTLLIPGKNDSKPEIDQMTKWIAENVGINVPLHFTAFSPTYKLTNNVRTPLEVLLKAREVALQNGLRYVYTGNVHNPETGSTYCHSCGEKVVSRDWHVIETYELDDNGHCTHCGEPCAGVFDGPLGSWGAKRLPLNLNEEAREA